LKLPPAGPHEVKVDSRWNYSAYENRPAATWLLTRAHEISGEGPEGLDRLVQRWPDLALQILRDGVEGDADMPVCLAIAESYDRSYGTTDPNAGWYAALNVVAPQRDAYNAFRIAREELLGIFQSGKFSDAAKFDVVAVLPPGAGPALQAEAYRLEGFSELLNDHPDRAAGFFTQAANWAQQGPHHVQFEIGLLLSESQRRAGQTQAAAATWQSAVIAGANVRDPDLWQRAILTKPADAAWPAQAAIAGAGEPNFAPDQAPDTGDVLIGIGKMRLVRGAAQSALVIFSQAETETNVPGEKSLAQLYRVQSMIALQMSASALPMLDGLLKSPDPRIACRAAAIEGDIYCRMLDDRAKGIPMMRSALENPDAGNWPGKSRLSANLALYYLLDGNEHEGLPRLHLAQAQFEAEVSWEDLASSLQDEAAFLRSENNSDADIVQKRADEVCRRAGLPTGPLTGEAVADDTKDDHATAPQ
jgi:hypothetical protein